MMFLIYSFMKYLLIAFYVSVIITLSTVLPSTAFAFDINCLSYLKL